MTTSVLVSSQIISPLLRFCDAQNVTDVNLREEIAAHQAAPRINIERWWALLERLRIRFPIPALGIQIGSFFQLEDAGALGFLVASCDNLLVALQKMQRYEPLIHNLSSVKATLKNEGLHLQWVGDGAVSTPLSNEYVLSSMLTVTQRLIGKKKLRPIRVELTSPLSGDATIYEALLGCPVTTTDSRLAIQLPIECLTWSIDTSNPHLRKILEQQAEAMLAASPKPDTFISEVQKKMLSGIESGDLNVTWLAEKMQFSERALYREFSARGHRFQDVLDQLRTQLAIRYLNSPELSLAEVSLMLNFSDQSAFSRAFKKWTGITPLQFRRTTQLR